MKMINYLLSFLLSFCFLVSAIIAKGNPTSLIDYFSEQQIGKMTAKQQHYYKEVLANPFVQQTKFARINTEALKESIISFSYYGNQFKAIKDKSRTSFDLIRRSWIGRIEGVNGMAHFVVKGDMVVGHVSIEGEVFSIQPLGEGLHVIADIDMTRKEGCLTEKAAKQKAEKGHDADQHFGIPDLINKSSKKQGKQLMSSTGECNIRVLVAYTSAARGVFPDILMEITNLINLANTGFRNSSGTGANIDMSIELAVAYEISYTESGNLGTDRDRFRATSDGFMDGVHTQRNLWDADQCALLVQGGGGIAYISNADADQFTVTGTNNFNALTFHHELGHSSECTHATTQDRGPGVPPFAGYGDPSSCYGTVLADSDACGPVSCPRQNIFSDNDTNSWNCGGVNYTPGTSQARNQDRLDASGPIIIDHRLVETNVQYSGSYSWGDEESVNFVASEEVGYNSSTNKFELLSGSEGSFRASQSVRLGRGFHARSGSRFRAFVDQNCTPFELTNAVTEGNENELAKSRAVNQDKDSSITDPVLTIYPNPFQTTATVEIDLIREEQVELILSNTYGQTLQIVFPSQKLGKGKHQISVDGEGLVAGLYYLSMRTSTKSIVKTLTLVTR